MTTIDGDMCCLLRHLFPEHQDQRDALISKLKNDIHSLQMQLQSQVHNIVWNQADGACTALASAYECKLCMNAPIEAVFMPCGHALSCKRCANANLKKMSGVRV